MCSDGFCWCVGVVCAAFVKSAADVSLFRMVVMISSINIVLSFPIRSFWGILSSNLRYDVSVYLEIINVVMKALLIVAFLKLGFGIIAVAIINFVADMLWYGANAFYALKLAPYIKISRQYFDIGKIKIFLNYSVYVFFSQIAGLVKYSIDNYVISAFVGLSAVTVYSIGTRLVGYAANFFNKLLGLMTPVFSQYEGQGNFDAIREKFLFMLKIGVYLAVFFSSFLIVLSRPFIARWVGPGYEEAHLIILIFSIPIMFEMIVTPSSQVLYGISKHKLLTWVNCGEALMNLVLSLILVQFWGIKGVALGTAIPSIITKLFIQPIYTAKVLNIKVVDLYVSMFTALVKGALVIAILYLLTQAIIAASFIRVIAYAAIQTACYAAIMFKIGLTFSEQDMLIRAGVPDRVKQWFQRRRSS